MQKQLNLLTEHLILAEVMQWKCFNFLIDEHLPGVVFQFEITADIMRPEVIQFLNENALQDLFRFEIGVQSTNDLTNELVQRRQNFEKLTRTVTMVKEGGKIDQHLDLIAGFTRRGLSILSEKRSMMYLRCARKSCSLVS